VRDHQPLDSTLTCPLCKKLLWEAVKTPCCDTAYCEECIQTYLLEHAFECPSCESKVASLEGLKVDDDLRNRIKGYVEAEIERSKREDTGAAEEGEEGTGVKVSCDPYEGYAC
jgi:protein MPE1